MACLPLKTGRWTRPEAPREGGGARLSRAPALALLAVSALWLGGALLLRPPSPLWAQNVYMEPVVISPRELIEAYLSNFHQADAMYTGKLLVVTGRIRDIFPGDMTYRRGPYPFVTIDSGPHQPIIVYLWDWEAVAIAQPRPGRTTSVMGFCQGVTAQLSLIDSCLYPGGCGGPVAQFYGPYFKLPPSGPRGAKRIPGQ
ncbi:MAG: OB-fold putative lipoprotein [Deltaproteobacteria bacterium]|nr:OB-fold putative lipoprotein [Deltaproteobacteria bacterium]